VTTISPTYKQQQYLFHQMAGTPEGQKLIQAGNHSNN